MKAEDRAWRPYPAYRDSGIEWLGKVPEHWHVRRMRHLATLNPPRSRIPELDPHAQVSFIPMEAVRQWGGLDLTATKCVAEVGYGYTYFQDGDILVAKITPCFENGKGARAQALSNGVGFGTTELHVLRPRREVDSWFLFYVTISQPFRTMGAAAMYGAAGQQRVPDSFVRNFFVALPPLPEQRAIAAFLDRETARIDALVEKKQRLIELLREKRQAVITRAVTRGLDPSVPMKESGVEWLGRVPEHWPIRRLKFVGRGGFQYGANEPSERGEAGWVRFVRISDLTPDGGLRDDTFAALPSDVARPFLLKDGDILFARSGATVGKTFRYRESWGAACFAGYLVRLTCNRVLVEPDFVEAWTQSDCYDEQVRQTFVQATIQNISAERYGNFVLALPPLAEQHQIVDHIRRETARIDALVSKLEQSIALLREHRQALITAAVTGQIDVREG